MRGRNPLKGDGRPDLVVTNLDFETDNLFRNLGNGLFYLSQNDLRTHFGLGGAPRAERIEVLWPPSAAVGIAELS